MHFRIGDIGLLQPSPVLSDKEEVSWRGSESEMHFQGMSGLESRPLRLQIAVAPPPTIIFQGGSSMKEDERQRKGGQGTISY